MITYMYWIAVFAVAIAIFLGIGIKAKNWKVGSIISILVLLTSWGVYYFRLQQIFVKKYGGIMSITVPEGQHHLGATWKDENLWVENYDPTTNTCTFSEYSKGNLLQGKVIIKNCNPYMPKTTPNISKAE